MRFYILKDGRGFYMHAVRDAVSRSFELENKHYIWGWTRSEAISLAMTDLLRQGTFTRFQP